MRTIIVLEPGIRLVLNIAMFTFGGVILVYFLGDYLRWTSQKMFRFILLVAIVMISMFSYNPDRILLEGNSPNEVSDIEIYRDIPSLVESVK